jgi:hypothetical protein
VHFFQPGAARRAAHALRRARRVTIVTGFALAPGVPETDGPPGAAVLGRALRRLGAEVRYLTDETSVAPIEAALKVLAEPVEIEVFPDGDPRAAAAATLAALRPTHLVAIERPGRTADGDYRSARGESVAAWNRPLDALFVRPSPVTTIAVGDGGNEIGMGRVTRRQLARAGVPARIASTVRVDHLVVAGVSNWGAYGIVAHLGDLAGRDLLHTPADERRLVVACIEAGAMDGVTRRPEATVDGISLEVQAGIVDLMRAMGGFR